MTEKIYSNYYSLNLDTNSENDHYEISIHAYNELDRNGYYMTTYKNGHGWDYRFIITGYSNIINNPPYEPYSPNPVDYLSNISID